jgi:hypothetical protein
MKDESTPESNAAERMAFSGEYMVPTEFARQLERDRNEAMEKYDIEATEHMLAVNKICGELDEARGEIDRYREKLDLVPISWDT